MRLSYFVVALAVVASCQDVTAANTGPVAVVTLMPKALKPACVFADPEPASVPANQGIAFENRSSVSITIVLVDDDTPLVSVAPGETSRAVKFRTEGVRQYYSLGCGSAAGERHTLAVTVN
jgi:hypothetical protein